MSEPEQLTLERQQVIRLLTIQGLVLSLVSLVWWGINPALPIFSTAKIHWISIGLGALAGLVLLLTSSLILLCYEDLRQALRFVDKLLLQHLQPADALYIAFISSIPEELFFRGILQNQFGIAVASIVFGLVHIPGRHLWAYGLWATCAGFYLGFLYDYSQSLWAVIVAHALHNLLGLWLWLYWRPQWLRATQSDASGD